MNGVDEPRRIGLADDEPRAGLREWRHVRGRVRTATRRVYFGFVLDGRLHVEPPHTFIVPILFAWPSVHQIVLCGPAVMANGSENGAGRAKPVVTPAVVMRTILPGWASVNQRLPSPAAVIPVAVAPGRLPLFPSRQIGRAHV